jgi:hypothetical protein
MLNQDYWKDKLPVEYHGYDCRSLQAVLDPTVDPLGLELVPPQRGEVPPVGVVLHCLASRLLPTITF